MYVHVHTDRKTSKGAGAAIQSIRGSKATGNFRDRHTALSQRTRQGKEWMEVGQQNQKPFKLTALSLHKPELAVAVLLGHADVFIAKWNTELVFLFG